MPYTDSQNAERLVNTYADTILRISYMYLKHTQDAEDICQDVLIKLISGNNMFDTDSHEKAWIIRTTINACKDHLRKSFWKRAVDIEKAIEVEAPSAPESDLLDMIMDLPDNYRISIYLRYYEGYTVREISSMLKKPENTILAYLTRGRNKLKALIEDSHSRKTSNMKGDARYV